MFSFPFEIDLWFGPQFLWDQEPAVIRDADKYNPDTGLYYAWARKDCAICNPMIMWCDHMVPVAFGPPSLSDINRENQPNA